MMYKQNWKKINEILELVGVKNHKFIKNSKVLNVLQKKVEKLVLEAEVEDVL